jgi:anaerobic magnesium-protoporphyrin IX monomethyl ester cyclase
LFGLESANQHTLDRINKGVKSEDYKYIIKASQAGLEPHIAVMFGYPWETDEDAERTLGLVHHLLCEGYARTAQASFYSPMGGSGKQSHKKFIQRIYDVCYSPHFWFNQIKSIKNEADLKYLWKKIKAGLNAFRQN